MKSSQKKKSLAFLKQSYQLNQINCRQTFTKSVKKANANEHDAFIYNIKIY